MSAGVAALIISCQPLFTSMLAPGLLGERVRARQWAGVAVGLAGVALVVWHKVDVREVGAASLACTAIALAGVTAATLYQKAFVPQAGLKAANTIQFAVAFAGFVPLAIAVEDFRVSFTPELVFSVVFLVLVTSLLGLSILYYLLRHGEAARVSGMMYLPPVFAVALELAFFGVAPSALMLAGMAVTCLGVAMIVWRPR
jgi:drug/metabolite transporter (DMT)-like permease